MILQINGEEREIPHAMTVSELLKWLEITPALVAVEINRQVISRSRHGEVQVAEGDHLEIVSFTGGG